MLALAAAALLLPASAAPASREDQAALTAYAQARVAGRFGAGDEAAKGYAAALAVSPDNETLAARAFIQALESGNRPLALSAARTLDRMGAVNSDARLLFVAEALRSRDWKRATLRIREIEQDEVFSFLVPVLRAWVAVGSGKGDPVAILDAGSANPLVTSYAQEHRPLLLLAAGRREEGAAALQKLAGGTGMRDQRLRIAGAALLARKNDPKRAAELLTGDEPALAAARLLLANKRPIPGGISTAPAGVAELLVRIAGDLHRQNASSLGLRFARLATFLAPENSETWLVTSDLLVAAGHNEAALAALGGITADDPFGGTASSTRIRLLVATDRKAAALTEAEAAAKAGAAVDWSRLGDLYGSLERQSDAAAAYARALTLVKEGDPTTWALHLLRGSALDRAGRWPEAKAALEAAFKLAPENAIVLNYLGYAQLERRENIEEAMRLIAEASRLQPDSAEITDSLGWAHYLRGNVPKAIELLERAAAGEPADPDINEHLGDAYYKAGRRYEARYAWRAALIYADEKDAGRLRAKIEAGLTPQLASP
jgi:tetratricopeptide (TPR) repeat protein